MHAARRPGGGHLRGPIEAGRRVSGRSALSAHLNMLEEDVTLATRLALLCPLLTDAVPGRRCSVPRYSQRALGAVRHPRLANFALFFFFWASCTRGRAALRRRATLFACASRVSQRTARASSPTRANPLPSVGRCPLFSGRTKRKRLCRCASCTVDTDTVLKHQHRRQAPAVRTSFRPRNLSGNQTP